MAGIHTTAELKAMVENYQKGQASVGSEPIESTEPAVPQFEDTPENIQATPENNQESGITYAGPLGALMRGKNTDPYATTFGEEMAEKGYGRSRFDERVGFTPGEDIEDLRAQEQSWAGKITNGLIKGGATTLTTAANSTVGLVAGLGSSMFELGKELLTDEKFSLGNIVNSGVNNSVSNFMIKLQEGMEEIAPNYRTAEERTDDYQRQWYKHMYTGNFIGDSFLKNLGFTAGSIIGGQAWNKIIGAAFASKLSADLMKGAVSASVAGDVEAMAQMKSAAEALKVAGNLNNADVYVVVKNFKDAAKTIKKASFTTQLLGATTAAMGEGTVEGIMARNEYLEEFNRKMDMKYAQEYESLEKRLSKEHPEWFMDTWETDESGNTVMKSVLVDEEGKNELLKRQLAMSEQYQKTKEFAETQGDVLARSTFLLNLPILMASNLIEFGRTFGGGWTTARRNIQSLSGELGNHSAKSSVAAKTALGSMKVGASEAAEEMLQGFASSGTKAVADARVSAFIDSGYDREAALKAVDSIYPFMQAGKDYLGDIKNWQEGAIGAITGLLGMASTHFRGNKTVGDYFKGWNGGVIGEYMRAKSEHNAAQAAADKLNELVNNPDFKKRWTNYVRHMKYDDDMLKAAQVGNEYAWHTADGNQLISDVIDFAETGKLNELYDFVDSVSTINPSDQNAIDDIKKIIEPKAEADKNLLDSMSNEYILKKVKTQADHMKKVIDSYREVYDNLATLMPQSADSNRFKELMFTSMQVKDFEDRFHSLLTDTLTAMDGLFQASASRKEGSPEEDETDLGKARRALQSMRLAYGDALSGGLGISVLDVAHVKAANSILDKAQEALESSIKKYNLVGDARSKITDTISKLQDMRKLAADRREFIKKILTLREMTDSKFDSTALNSDKAKQQIEAEDNAAQQAPVEEGRGVAATQETRNPIQSSSIKKNAALVNFSNKLQTVATANDSTIVRAVATRIVYQMYNNPDSTYEDIISMAEDKMPSVDEVFAELMKSPTFKNFTGEKQDIYDKAVELAHRVLSRVSEDMGKLSGLKPASQSRSEQGPTRRQQNSGPSKEELAEEKKEEEKKKQEEAEAAAALAPKVSGHDEPNGSTDISSKYKVGDKVSVADSAGTVTVGVVTKVEFNKDEGTYYIHVEDVFGDEIAVVPEDSASIYSSTPVSDIEEEASGEQAGERQDIYSEEPTVTEPAAGSYLATQRGEELSFEEDTALAEATESDERDYPDVDSLETDQSGKQTYYNTAIPELDLDVLRAIRADIAEGKYGGIRSKNFKKFIEANPNYKDLWDYLLDHDAFNNMDKLVVSKDKKAPIYFVVDPNAPIYTDSKGRQHINIFMAYKDSAGQYKIFNVLRENFGRNAKREWAGLNALRKAILDEYDTYTKDSSFNGDAFVFSKNTNAWLRRAGYIEYGDSIKDDTPIHNKDGYDSDASIVTVDSDGNIVTLYGKSPVLRDKFIDSVHDAVQTGNKTLMVGNVYYIARGADNYGIPIRLNVEHYNESTVKNTGYGYDQITDILQEIVDLAHKFSEDKISSDDANLKKTELVNKLGKYLDVHGIVLHFTHFEDEPVVRFYYYEDSFDDNGKYTKGDLKRTPDFVASDINVDALKDEIAKLNRSFFVDTHPSEDVSRHIHQMAETGLFTSNAVKMRAQGTDIYMDAYNQKTGKFESPSRSSETYSVKENSAESEESDVDFYGNEFDEQDYDKIGFMDSSESEESEIPGVSEDVQDESDSEVDELSYEYIAENNEAVYAKMNSHGVTKEKWDSWPTERKKTFIRCA